MEKRRGRFGTLGISGKQVQQRAHEQHRAERQPRVALLTANSRFQAPHVERKLLVRRWQRAGRR